MAHAAQRGFCLEVKQRFPQFFRGRRVLEIGSRNVNGTVRCLFESCEYVGVDCVEGDGVDVVCLGHEYNAKLGAFDVACAGETFEHDPHAEQTIGCMLQLLRPGGLFFMTCAGDGRQEHGTTRTGSRYGPEPDFYRNVSLRQFSDWLRNTGALLSEIHLRHNHAACDLYCWAVKGESTDRSRSGA